MIKCWDYLREYKKLKPKILRNPANVRIIPFKIFFVKFFLSCSKFVKVQKKKTKKLVTRLYERHSMINAM